MGDQVEREVRLTHRPTDIREFTEEMSVTIGPCEHGLHEDHDGIGRVVIRSHHGIGETEIDLSDVLVWARENCPKLWANVDRSA